MYTFHFLQEFFRCKVPQNINIKIQFFKHLVHVILVPYGILPFGLAVELAVDYQNSKPTCLVTEVVGVVPGGWEGDRVSWRTRVLWVDPGRIPGLLHWKGVSLELLFMGERLWVFISLRLEKWFTIGFYFLGFTSNKTGQNRTKPDFICESFYKFL